MAPMAAESRLPLAAIVLVAITSTLLLAPPVVANQDADALSTLRRGLQDPNGALKSWDPKTPAPGSTSPVTTTSESPACEWICIPPFLYAIF
uniref:Leucine-rich repeat-containing N-terminal plant-type domain-containing protein n=1 Tax=Hordeum vulgare subsp. vulgare TaxID=112509 RepID=A0A8I6WV70_HORVV